MASTKHRMKLAKTSTEEIMSLLTILNEIESLYKYDLSSTHFEDVDFSEYEILNTFRKDSIEDFMEDLCRHLSGIHFQRILWNCDTMLKNCADPDADTLEFNKDIQRGLELLEEAETKEQPFKPSGRAKQLSKLIAWNFKIELSPAIKRRYQDCEIVKFEMKDDDGNIYLFNGLVQDFLSKNAIIRKHGVCFTLENF